jgi:putative endonuclease
MERAQTGRIAEDLVAGWLSDRGFAIVGRNVRVGRLELDLVARRAGLLVVCEVRARRGQLVDPAETFDAAKRARTRRAALEVWSSHGRGCALRLDAAAVTFDDSGAPRLRYYENAFAWDP